MYYSRKLKKPSNIFDVFKSFYYISRFLGTVPFTITVERDNNVILKTKIKDYIIFGIFNIIFLIIVCLWGFGKLSTDLLNSSSDVENYGNKFMIVSSMCFSITNNLINFIFKKKTIEIINDLISVDSSIKMINLDVDYKSQSRTVNRYLFMSFSVVIGVAIPSAVVFYQFSNNLFQDFCLYTTLVLNSVYYVNLVSQFVLFLLSVYERFRQLNRGIEEIFKFDQPKYERQDFSEVVKQISGIHNSLIEIVQKINFRFSTWIMIATAVIFAFFTFSAFAFVRAVIIFDKSKFLFSFSVFIWSIYYLSFLVMAIAVGSWTTRMVFIVKYCMEELNL